MAGGGPPRAEAEGGTPPPTAGLTTYRLPCTLIAGAAAVVVAIPAGWNMSGDWPWPGTPAPAIVLSARRTAETAREEEGLWLTWIGETSCHCVA